MSALPTPLAARLTPAMLAHMALRAARVIATSPDEWHVAQSIGMLRHFASLAPETRAGRYAARVLDRP